MAEQEGEKPVYLIDASVILATYFPGENLSGAEQLLKRFGADACELVLLELTKLEVANGVLLAHRNDRIEQEHADRIIQNFRSLNVRTIDTADIQDAYRLGSSHTLTAYDAQYVATAIQAGVQLVTADRSLMNALPEDMDAVVWIDHFASSDGS